MAEQREDAEQPVEMTEAPATDGAHELEILQDIEPIDSKGEVVVDVRVVPSNELTGLKGIAVVNGVVHYIKLSDSKEKAPPVPVAERVIATMVVHRTFEHRVRSDLRTWWHRVLRDHGRYSSFAFVLVLPGDADAIRYLTELGTELDQISGDDCLVIALADLGVRRSGFDEELWAAAVETQASKGYSLTVAELFGIDLTEFPCLVLFEDVRRPRHVVVSLKGLDAEGIGEEMRSVFSTVRKAARETADPLAAVEESQRRQGLREKGESIAGQVRSFAGKTFETAMEALVKALVEK